MLFLRCFTVLLFLFAFSLYPLYAKVVDRTLAIVNGEAIMLSEFNKTIDPVMEQYKLITPAADRSPEKVKELKEKLLDQMIDEKLLKQEAKKEKIRVSKRDVEDGIEQVKKRFATEAEFQKELEKENIKMSDFEKRIKDQIMVMKLTEQKMKSGVDNPQEDEVKEFYENIKKKMEGKNLGLENKKEEEMNKLAKYFSRATSEQIRARHILIQANKNASMKEKSAARRRINEIKKKIKEGADFTEMVKEYSEDPGSKNRGGDLGYFAKGDMVPEFEKAAFSLKVGEVSDPVLTDFGYHIIRLEEKRASTSFSFEAARNDLEQYLYQLKIQEEYEKWLKSLRAKATIKINDIE